MGGGIKLTLGDGSEITGAGLEEAFERLKQDNESRRMKKIANIVGQSRASATVNKDGNRI